MIIFNCQKQNDFRNMKSSFLSIPKLFNLLLDRSTLFISTRWVILTLLLTYALYRVIFYQFLAVLIFAGFYSVYFLLQYFTPIGLIPSVQSNHLSLDLNDDLDDLRERQPDRPLLRALNEFSLWKHLMGLGLATIFCTMFELLAMKIPLHYLIGFLAWLTWMALQQHKTQKEQYHFDITDFKNKRSPQRTPP